MKAHIHSVQSLGTVDGPGLRYVVFMQGCPLRCCYCHNPDTWKPASGTEISVKELTEKILRCRPYFKNGGGVTVSGGEPLLQANFVAELFETLHRFGIHTALDTSCHGSAEQIEAVLKHTDLALADVKFTDAEEFSRYCRGDLTRTEAFLKKAEEMQIPVWIRHVVVPGLNDTPESLRRLYQFARRFTNIQKIEYLPFRKLCMEKYQQLEIPFPLADTPEMDAQRLQELTKELLLP